MRAMYGTGFQQVGPAVSSVSSATQAEGTSLVHTVTLASAVSGTPGKYAFNLTAGTASAPSDYTATPTFSNSVTLSGGVLTVPIAVTTFTITVATTDDAVYEGSEAYSVTVGNVTNTGTITDNESAPTVTSVSSASATEGSNIVHTVAVTGVAQAARTFALVFSGAAVGGTDYNATPTFSAGVTLSGGNITVSAGVTSFTVTVGTINNALTDGSRAYTLTIGGASGTGSISDDETPSPAFTATLTALTNATGTVTTLAYINAGSGGTITPSVSVSRTSGKEMLAVYFDASGTTHSTITNPEHELFYAWDFGDDVAETWAYGTDTTRNKNVAYGPQAAHVYKTAGTKTWTLVVIDGAGGTATRTGTVTVSAWTEAETIYIANGSTPTAGSNDVGSGALGYYNETTAAGMLSRITANPGKRILLDRASTWVPTSTTTLTSHTGTHIGSYGAGTRATLNPAITSTYSPMLIVDGSCSDIRISGLKMNATVADVVGAICMQLDASANMLVHDCEITGAHEGIDGTGGTNVFLDSCNIHDIGTANTSAVNGTFYYGVFLGNVTKVAIVGTAVDNVYTGHCVRLHPHSKVAIHNSTIRKARRGYGGGNGHALTIRGPENSGTWGGVWTEKMVLRENLIGDTDDGLEPLQIAPENTGIATRQRNVIVENNIIKSKMGSCLITEVCSRFTFRSNICHTSGNTYPIHVTYQNAVGTPAASDSKFYNNTIYKPDASLANGFSAFLLESGTSGTLIYNNLAYAPADTADAYGAGSAPTLIAGTGTYTASNNSSNTQIKNTKPWAATTPSAAADYTPQAGNYAINGGTSVPVIKDFFNATITGTREIGAIQV